MCYGKEQIEEGKRDVEHTFPTNSRHCVVHFSASHQCLLLSDVLVLATLGVGVVPAIGSPNRFSVLAKARGCQHLQCLHSPSPARRCFSQPHFQMRKLRHRAVTGGRAGMQTQEVWFWPCPETSQCSGRHVTNYWPQGNSIGALAQECRKT